MKLKSLKLTPILLAAGVIAVVCALKLLHFEFFERLERITYDLRVREAYKHAPAVAENLGFVAISDDTIDRVRDGSLGFKNGLLWPRHIYGRVARELYTEGAKAVAYDVLFSELRPDHFPVLMGDQDKPVTIESDQYFAEKIKQAGNVILAAEHGVVPPAMFRTNALALGDITAERDPDGVLRRAKAFRTYNQWNTNFQAVAEDADYDVNLDKAIIKRRQIILPRSIGDITFQLDEFGRFDVADFIGKKIPPGTERYQKPFTEVRVWHMGIVLAAQELKLDLNNPELDWAHGRIILRGPGVERIIPVDEDGYFYIDWCLRVNDPRLDELPFEKLLEYDAKRLKGKTNGLSNRWRDKLVVIGSSAVGNNLTDRGATPLEKDTFLVSKHWNVANSVLTGRFIRRGGDAEELLLILCMGVLAAVLTLKLSTLRAVLSVVLALLVYVLLAFMVYVRFRYWVPITLPVMGGLLITHACLLAHLVIFEQKERRRVRSVFSKVVSPNIVNELLQLEKLSWGGARRNVTVLFSDIRGFTELTDLNREKAALYVKKHTLVGDAAQAVFDEDARDSLATVNLYLSLIAEKVIQNNGTIDKFIGDCVMAFWGAPVDDPQHALHCVRAAIDIQRAVYRLNRERQGENHQREDENIKRTLEGQPLLPMLPIVAVGTGINTGDVTIGMIGSDQHGLNYTVFGREVNLASRLESVSGRGRIIISEATLAHMINDDADLATSCAALPPEKVKGFKEAVHIFEVPWRTGEYAPTGETVAPFKVVGDDTKHFAKPGS